MPTVLIAGASRGIGLELVRQYLERGGVRVIALHRPGPDAPPALVALAARHPGRLRLVAVDLANASALANLPSRLSERIDVLINSAGVVVEVAAGGSGLRPAIRMSSVSPLMVTSAVLANMTRNGKIAVVSAVVGYASPAAEEVRPPRLEVDRIMQDLAADLKPLGIAVAIIQPEAPRLDAGEADAEASAAAAAAGIIAVIDELDPSHSGEVFVLERARPAIPHPAALS